MRIFLRTLVPAVILIGGYYFLQAIIERAMDKPAALPVPVDGVRPHLHYGVYDTGGAINPYPLLRAGPAAPPVPPR